MLTKFAAALLATTLVAGSAIAAQPSGAVVSPNTPATQMHSPSMPAASANKAGKTLKHAARHRSHRRKHLARSKSGGLHQARHAKPAAAHQARVGKSANKSANKSEQRS
jgi:hypothetical protein